MTLGDLAIVFSISTSLVGGAGLGADYYLKHEYVPVSSLLKRDIRDTQFMIRELEYDKNTDGLTDKEEWQLDQYYKDLEELKQELNN